MPRQAIKFPHATAVTSSCDSRPKLALILNLGRGYNFPVSFMAPEKEWSPKRERQYEHVKESEEERGKSETTSKRIAAATVNKTRKERGETKGQKKG